MNTNVLGIFAPTLIRFGTAEQCQRLLPGMLDHEVIWCQGFSEPGAGSDLAGISTRATVSGDTVHITGQKVWTSNAHRAAYCYLLARTSSSQRRHDGLTMIALPMDQPGVTVRPLRNIVGTSEFCEVFLDDARAPVANIIGDVGTGWKLAMFALSQERSVGLAQRSLKLSGEFSALAELCNEERAAGNPRLTDEFYAGPLVDAYVRALTVSATVRRAVEVDAAGGDLRDLAPVAKVSWSEGHQQQLALALEVLGDRWTDEADPVARNWWQAGLFARAETIYGGTSQIQRTVLARALGLPRGA